MFVVAGVFSRRDEQMLNRERKNDSGESWRRVCVCERDVERSRDIESERREGEGRKERDRDGLGVNGHRAVGCHKRSGLRAVGRTVTHKH